MLQIQNEARPVTVDGAPIGEADLKALLKKLKKMKPTFDASFPELARYTDASLSNFGAAIYDTWLADGSPPKSKWMLLQVALMRSDALIDRIARDLAAVFNESHRRGAWHVAVLENAATNRSIAWIRWWASIERVPLAGRPISMRRDCYAAGRRILSAASCSDADLLGTISPTDLSPNFKHADYASENRWRHVFDIELFAAMNARVLLPLEQVERWLRTDLALIVSRIVFVDGRKKVVWSEDGWWLSDFSPAEIEGPLFIASPADFTDRETQGWGHYFAQLELVDIGYPRFDQFNGPTVFS